MSDDDCLISTGTSRALTAEEKFYYEARYRQVELSLTRMNDSLNRLVTLGTAMCGGALVLLKEDICPVWWRVATAALFFLALATGVLGSVPVAVSGSDDPAAVRDGMVYAASVKKRYVWAASGLLMAGLLTAIVGAVVRAAG